MDDAEAPAALAEPLIVDADAKIFVYGRRWYVLTVFSLLAVAQATTWNIYGPIADPVRWRSGDSLVVTLLRA